MQVKVVRAYKDKELGRMTVIGEPLEVDEERGQHLVSIGYAEIADEYIPRKKGRGNMYGTSSTDTE